MAKRRLQLLLGIFLLTLGLASPASANNVKIALTATLQEPTVPIPSTGATQWPVSKLRITEKDILALLALDPLYTPLPDGANLSYVFLTGFVIRKEDGGIQFAVDSSNLSLGSLERMVERGVWGPVITANKTTILDYVLFEMSIDASNAFELNGFSEDKLSQTTPSTLSHNVKLTLMGRGKLSNKKCAISGTIKIKYTSPAV